MTRDSKGGARCSYVHKHAALSLLQNRKHCYLLTIYFSSFLLIEYAEFSANSVHVFRPAKERSHGFRILLVVLLATICLRVYLSSLSIMKLHYRSALNSLWCPFVNSDSTSFWWILRTFQRLWKREVFSQEIIPPSYERAVRRRLFDILRLRIGALVAKQEMDVLIAAPNQVWTTYLLNR